MLQYATDEPAKIPWTLSPQHASTWLGSSLSILQLVAFWIYGLIWNFINYGLESYIEGITLKSH